MVLCFFFHRTYQIMCKRIKRVKNGHGTQKMSWFAKDSAATLNLGCNPTPVDGHLVVLNGKQSCLWQPSLINIILQMFKTFKLITNHLRALRAGLAPWNIGIWTKNKNEEKTVKTDDYDGKSRWSYHIYLKKIKDICRYRIKYKNFINMFEPIKTYYCFSDRRNQDSYMINHGLTLPLVEKAWKRPLEDSWTVAAY